MLTKHVEQAPIKVKAELKTMPARSVREHNAKARMSGELTALERCRDGVKAELARVEEEAAAYATARKEFLASKTRSDKGSKSKK
jgi:hypothetical protein